MLATYVSATAAYAWYSPEHGIGTARRFMAAGGASLVAVAIALLIVGVGVDIYGIELATARHLGISPGDGILLAAGVVGPAALIALGMSAKTGNTGAALAAMVLCVAGYGASLVGFLLVQHPAVDPSSADVLVPAAVGLIPVFLLGVGIMRSIRPLRASTE